MGSIGQGFNRWFSYAPQTAHGTKNASPTTAMVPLRGGSIFQPNPITQRRADAINALAPKSFYYTVPKIVPWQASFYVTNPTTAHKTLRDFLRAVYGRETLAVGPPITKTFDVFDPLVDGATDTATVLYGRVMTLHEQVDDSTGVKISSDEVQDAIVEELAVTWEPDQPVRFDVSGMASDYQDDMVDVTPVYPDGQLFTFAHVRDVAVNAGLRIGTANPPVAADNVIFSRATLRIRNEIRYTPFLGNGTTKQVRIPTRNGPMQITLEVVMDVESATASLYDSSDAKAHFVDGTGVNCRFLTYIDANNIMDFKSTGTTAAGFIESSQQAAQNEGAMQYTFGYRVAPAALADTSLVFTTVS